MDLLDFDFSTLLPGSLTADDAMLAAASAVERQLLAVSGLMRNVAIWSRLDEMTEPLLSTLAWQLHVDDFEGWAFAETDEQKRRLLRESLLIHRYKGTRWSLERVFTLLDMRGEAVEWFEYGGDPYRFMVDLYPLRALGETFSDEVLALIDALKNVRSWLDRLRIIPETTGTIHTAAIAWSSQVVAIRPPLVTDVANTGPVRTAAGCAAIMEATLYPLPLLEVHGRPVLGVGCITTGYMSAMPLALAG
jgi:phage tail P2-like protein